MTEKGVKRSISEAENVLDGINVVLVDIEGTTTPITFVTEVLFGHVKKNLKTYLEAHVEEDECQEDIKALQAQIEEDKKQKIEGVPEIPALEADNKDAVVQGALENVEWQMKSDRKTTALKQLQGHIWRHAFHSGEVKGRVYQDVVDFLKSWTSQGNKAYIYSSGSVEAQKLLFGHTEHGDLTEYLSGHFDTKIGPKRDKDSYLNILKDIHCKSSEVLFLTDIPAEAKAAIEAGLKAYIVAREGNAELTQDDKKKYHTISSFNELTTETTQSKK